MAPDRQARPGAHQRADHGRRGAAVGGVAASAAAAAFAFAATDVDDLLLLVAWFAAGTLRARDIVLGQYAGIAALFLASAALSAAALAVPAGWLPWLGVLPILIGLRLLRGRHAPEEAPAPAAGALSVAAVTVANGGDNIGVYVPLFATSSVAEIAVMGAVFAAMTGLWCAAAHWLARHPAGQAPLRRWAPRTVPWVLIALGAWILSGLFS